MKYVLVGGTLGILALGFVTCQSDETPASACPLPEAGSQQATIISDAEQRTRFKLDYPCYLPNAQKLESHSVTGNAGQQKSEFVFDGPFDIAVRQAQVPPPIHRIQP